MSRADEVKYLVQLRDGFLMATDAITEFLETKKPYEKTVKHDPKEFDKLHWESKQGAKGPFERTSKKANNGSDIFLTLQKILKKSGGFLQLGDYKYWFDNQDDKQNLIDRRKKGAKKAEKSTTAVKSPEGPIPLGLKGSSEDTPRIKDIRSLFSPQLESLLSFAEEGEFIVIRSRQWLGSEDFSKISTIIRGINGEWISAGKQSHFRVAVKAVENQG